jgi:hypothetical protein
MTTLGNSHAAGTDGDLTGRAAEVIADGLNSNGFDVRFPGLPGRAYLQVTNTRDASCELTVYASGAFDWEYRYRDGSRADPTVLSAMTMRILAGDHAARACARLPYNPRMTVKAQVGRAIADQGMRVSLNVLEKGESDFEVYAEITAINPAHPGRGTVRVSDDGLISWRGQIAGTGEPDEGLGVREITQALASALAYGGLPR